MRLSNGPRLLNVSVTLRMLILFLDNAWQVGSVQRTEHVESEEKSSCNYIMSSYVVHFMKMHRQSGVDCQLARLFRTESEWVGDLTDSDAAARSGKAAYNGSAFFEKDVGQEYPQVQASPLSHVQTDAVYKLETPPRSVIVFAQAHPLYVALPTRSAFCSRMHATHPTRWTPTTHAARY